MDRVLLDCGSPDELEARDGQLGEDFGLVHHRGVVLGHELQSIRPARVVVPVSAGLLDALGHPKPSIRG